jgi:hypothetical protein
MNEDNSEIPKDDAKVLMFTSCSKLPASSGFFECFYTAWLPEGSERIRVTNGHYPSGMNVGIQYAIDNKFTHIFYVDDDFLFPPDIVQKLLSHNVDCCGALLTQRLPPFRPCIFNYIDDKGKLGFQSLTNETGLVKILATGGLPNLTKVSVFEKLSKPYYPNDTFFDDVNWGSDILFAKKLIDAKIPCFVDLDRQIWHAGSYSVTARMDEGKWTTLLNIGGTTIKIPVVPDSGVAKPKPELKLVAK